MLDVGQANELKLAFRRANWTNADIKKLSEGDAAERILPVIRGLAEVSVVCHQIDCDSNPFVPKNWEVESHTKGGTLTWDPSKLKLHLSPNQQNSKVIEGNKLREELESEQILNANVLDYLLVHTELIPKDWKGKYVFFWGTIYRRSDGGLCVRYLHWYGGRWYWGCNWLGYDFDDGYPALLRAK